MNILFLCWEIVVWSEYFFFILLENQEFISQDNKKKANTDIRFFACDENIVFLCPSFG